MSSAAGISLHRGSYGSVQNDGLTAAVAVIAVLLWHNPQLFVLASCQGWVRDSP